MSPVMPSLRYTSREAISYRLANRLQIGGGTQNTIGKAIVDGNLLDLVAFQVEATVTLQLSALYQTPLKLIDPDTRNAIASIVEKLTLGGLLPVQFVQIGDNTKEAGLRWLMAKEGQQELKALVDGSIFLPGETVQQVSDRVQRHDVRVGKRGTRTSRSPRGTTRLKPRSQPAETIAWDQRYALQNRPNEFGNSHNSFGDSVNASGEGWYGGGGNIEFTETDQRW